MSLIDRYVIRQVLMPFLIGLFVFTFLLIIPPLVDYAEDFVAKGAPMRLVLWAMVLLLPSALALTIPMSLLLGLLIAFGRLSSDREFVALQACGVSLSRLLRPVAFVSILGWAATSYVFLYGVPAGNTKFREVVFSVIASSAEGDVRPRVFYTQFPNLVLYVREVPTSGGWNGVFIADTRSSSQDVYLARRGRVVINHERQTVDMVLEDASRHQSDPSGKYVSGPFERATLTVNPESVFPSGGVAKSDNEKTIAELRATIATQEETGGSTHNQWMAIHQKFSIPVACLVFGLIGLALGATNRRDTGLGSFVIGVIVVFMYYVPLYLGRALAKGGDLSPLLATWLPNVVLGVFGILLFLWRDRIADQPIKISVPSVLRRRRSRAEAQVASRHGGRLVPLLDRYVAALYGRILLLSVFALMGVFYISTFIDRAEKVFKGTASWRMLAEYLWFLTPQYLYFVIPLSVLVAALVTVAILTKYSELIVMKACGISLYRVALPMFACALAAGAVLFGLDATVMGSANRRAEEIKLVMNGSSPALLYLLNRQWIAGRDDRIYHFNSFDPRARRLTGLDVFEFSERMSGLRRRTFAERAEHVATGEEGPMSEVWKVTTGWVREFNPSEDQAAYTPLAGVELDLESPEYFGTEEPDARFLSYRQLLAYTERLGSSGVNVLEQQVDLARKLAFPAVPLIMTLIAVPFAVTTGRSGALAGIGIGIALAISYRVAESLFGALGAGGMMPPTLAAWSPNLLFGAGALYLLLTVRT